MDKSKGGKGGIILNIASQAGLEPFPGIEGYCATKHAILGFHKALSFNDLYAVTGVAMITLCPGCTETPILENIKSLQGLRVQPVNLVGEYLVNCIEIGKNGAIYFIENSVGKEIQQNPYYLD